MLVGSPTASVPREADKTGAGWANTYGPTNDSKKPGTGTRTGSAYVRRKSTWQMIEEEEEDEEEG